MSPLPWLLCIAAFSLAEKLFDGRRTFIPLDGCLTCEPRVVELLAEFGFVRLAFLAPSQTLEAVGRRVEVEDPCEEEDVVCENGLVRLRPRVTVSFDELPPVAVEPLVEEGAVREVVEGADVGGVSSPVVWEDGARRWLDEDVDSKDSVRVEGRDQGVERVGSVRAAEWVRVGGLLSAPSLLLESEVSDFGE